jgi:hypothetical protein
MLELLKLLRLGGLGKRFLGNTSTAILFTPKDKKYEHTTVYKMGEVFTATKIKPDGSVGSRCKSEDRPTVAGFILGGNV